MNKSVLIATCDFLVLAVLSLNPSDKGSYNDAEKQQESKFPVAKPIAALQPVDDFKVEPPVPVKDDAFDQQLLLLAADDEKTALAEKLLQAQKDAEAANERLKQEALAKAKLLASLTEKEQSNKALKEQTEAERRKLAEAAKKQASLDSELALIRKSVVNITEANQKNIDLLNKAQKEKQAIADGRAFMKAKLLESLQEKKLMQAELDRAKKLNEETLKEKEAKEKELQLVSAEKTKLETDLKVATYKQEIAVKQQAKAETKLEVVAKERNELQTNLAVTKKESELLTGKVQTLKKEIYGPSPEINKVLFKTTFSFKEDDFMTKTYNKSSYSPVVKINGSYYTLANYNNMWLNRAIVPTRKLLKFSIMQKSEVTGKSYRVTKAFAYFKNSAQTLLVPTFADPNALKISASVNNITEALPTFYLMKQDTGKVVKLNNIFYNREHKRLMIEQGLAEDASANRPELGDLIVDPNGDLVAIIDIKESNFSLSKSTQMEAFVITDNQPLRGVNIKEISKIPNQLRALKSSIRD